jgi:flagellar motor switch protein FliG
MLPNAEKLAVLLSFLGEDAVDAAMKNVAGGTSGQVRAALDDFKRQPPTKEEVEFVIDDFTSYFRRAMKQVESAETAASKSTPTDDETKLGILEIPEEEFAVELEPVKKFHQPSLTGEVEADLNRLHPYRVAHAIRNENPATVALILSSLATEHAAKTLEFLPDDLRPLVFLRLAQPTEVTQLVIDCVLSSTLKAALLVEEREPEEDNVSEMIQLMRSVPKAVRVPMLAELIKTDEVLGNEVKSKLFQFSDIDRLSDKDIQQVLGQATSDSLVLALQNTDPELVDRILGNMSKRARESLVEEMEFKADATEDEITEGRTELVKVMVSLEDEGTISFE